MKKRPKFQPNRIWRILKKVMPYILLFWLFVISLSIHLYAGSLEKKAEEAQKRFEFAKVTRLNPNFDVTSPTGIYIPRDLKECHAELDRMLHPKARKYMAGQLKHLSEYEDHYSRSFGHHGLGMYLRNQWGLWQGRKSRLYVFFHDLGLRHPDDMSSVIFGSYYKHLNRPIIQIKLFVLPGDTVKRWEDGRIQKTL